MLKGGDGKDGSNGNPGNLSRIRERCKPQKSECSNFIRAEWISFPHLIKYYYYDYGSEGKVGGNGGKGGLAGYNGLSGEFILIYSKGRSFRYISKVEKLKNGDSCKPHGDSGNPGQGGLYGETLEGENLYGGVFFYVIDQFYSRFIPSSKPKASPGIRNLEKNINPNEKEKSIANYIQATVSSLMMRYNSTHEKIIVVNLEKYLKIILTQIKSWKTLFKQKEINIYKEIYEMNLKTKIKEAINLIEVLQKDIQINENQLNKDIDLILNEIVELKKQVKEEDSRLVKKKEELRNALDLKTLFSVLQIGANIMSFLGPKGAFIGSLAQAGVGLISQSIQNNNNFEVSYLSPVADTAIKKYQEFLKIKNTDQLDKLENDIKVLETENNFKNSKHISLESRLEKLPNSLKKNKLKKKFAENKKASSSNESDKRKYENLLKEAENEIVKLKNKVSDSDKKFDSLNKGVDIAEKCFNLASEIEMDSEKIKIAENEIQKNTERFNGLYEIEKSMNEMQNTLFNEMNQEINSFNTNLYNNSNALLDIKQWQIKDRLNEIKDQIFALTNAFVGHKKVSNTISRIENAIETMINIHMRIENFEQQNKFTNYITNIIQNKDITYKNLDINYQKKIESLEKIILENIIEERYQQAVEAFKYWSFPFYCEYTQTTENFVNDNSNDIDLKVSKYEKNLEIFLNHVRTDNAEIRPTIDNHVVFRLFDRNIPFFQWNSKTYPYELKRLLSGKLTTLYADINYSKFDAIKFCTLDILIETNTPSTNKTLNDLLKNFMIELTYSGESNYKYKGKTEKSVLK
jgi:hypothetical protein